MSINDPISEHVRLTTFQESALKKLGLSTLKDVLYHFPQRYENISNVAHIKDLQEHDEAIIYGWLEGLKTRKAFRSRRPIAEGYVRDETGRMKIIWFNQPYIAKMYTQESPVKVVGKVSGSSGKLYLPNPEVEHIPGLPIAEHALFEGSEKVHAKTHTLFPIYPESKGITSKWFYHRIGKFFGAGILDTLEDPLPASVLKKYNLPALKNALVFIHTPKKEKDAQSARKRFAFEEIFAIQIKRQQDRSKREKHNAFRIDTKKTEIENFVKRFDFNPTKAQRKAIREVLDDLKRGTPMARLLEGDVGSGKTAVAATTVYAVATTPPLQENGMRQDFGRLQTAYMVPTEILAKQHFESFIDFFKHMPVNIGLITSSGCKKFPSKVNPHEATSISRSQLLKWIHNGEIPIVIGTHALIQKTVQFENLAYVIIDEQHRFGTMQRKELTRKDNIIPHLLSMTATPIPRTLALTIYGDLDLTLLDEMPAGRKPIITEIVYPKEREGAYEKMREELEAGRQAYVICPRIDEPDPEKEMVLNVKSIKEECARLKREIFPEYEIAILHSKMKPAEKESVMQNFLENKINILVATSVVEVGVNVPNATVILLEGAGRFGLAQLHQLRGRVLRSSHQAYCFVFADSKSTTTRARLKAFKTARNGFELAEHDLFIRGTGELYGRSQSGLSDMGMEALKNLKLVEAARSEAEKLIEEDPTLQKHLLLVEKVKEKESSLHFE